MTSVDTARNLGAERAYVAGLQEGTDTHARAQLRLQELEWIVDAQRLAGTRSAICSQIDAHIGEGSDRRVNPNRPYLTWACCDEHRELKTRREQLRATAAEIGVQLSFNVQTVIRTDAEDGEE